MRWVAAQAEGYATTPVCPEAMDIHIFDPYSSGDVMMLRCEVVPVCVCVCVCCVCVCACVCDVFAAYKHKPSILHRSVAIGMAQVSTSKGLEALQAL